MSNGPDSVKGFNYLYGLINLAVIFCIVWVLWFVFMHADGVMKLYTPMYGFSLVVILLASGDLAGPSVGLAVRFRTSPALRKSHRPRHTGSGA